MTGVLAFAFGFLCGAVVALVAFFYSLKRRVDEDGVIR